MAFSSSVTFLLHGVLWSFPQILYLCQSKTSSVSANVSCSGEENGTCPTSAPVHSWGLQSFSAALCLDPGQKWEAAQGEEDH